MRRPRLRSLLLACLEAPGGPNLMHACRRAARAGGRPARWQPWRAQRTRRAVTVGEWPERALRQTSVLAQARVWEAQAQHVGRQCAWGARNAPATQTQLTCLLLGPPTTRATPAGGRRGVRAPRRALPPADQPRLGLPHGAVARALALGRPGAQHAAGARPPAPALSPAVQSGPGRVALRVVVRGSGSGTLNKQGCGGIGPAASPSSSSPFQLPWRRRHLGLRNAACSATARSRATLRDVLELL